MRTTLCLIICCIALLPRLVSAQEENCLTCHEKQSPMVVEQWRASKHGQNEIGCLACHDPEISKTIISDRCPEKVAVVVSPTVCATCHDTQVAQFTKGKHALAWVSMNAMPTIHAQPVAMTYGMKGCGGCHKVGLKSDEDLKKIAVEGSRTFGNASCDACHTRHTFSVKEAKQPQACQTCHMGFDHPQWEMYSASKHGVRALLKQAGTLPASTPTPVEQKLFVMFLEHRMRAFQGTFHANPDYALWYGWSELQRSLAEIKEESARLRRDHRLQRFLAESEVPDPEEFRRTGVYLGRDACTNHAQVKIDGHTVLVVEVRRLQPQEDN